MTKDNEPQASLPADTLTTGVTCMMLLTVAQRGVGLLRTVLFCRLLSEEELGQWSLVFSFVALFAPLSVFGITGSFGRYVEHYLRKGLLKRFLVRAALATGLLAASMLTLIWGFRDTFAWCVLGDAQQVSLILPACLTLAATVLYNYFVETLIALRRIRAGSTMELISSWSFALLGVVLLATTDLGSVGVIVSFAAGNLIASLYAFHVLRQMWTDIPQQSVPFSSFGLWRKLAPFAMGLWLINIVTNLFDMVDRYMIVHFSRIDPTDAQALVGQYFSSMALPLLMVGISSTLAHLVMPYLSEDWEAGRRQEVSARLNLALKMLGVALCFGSACMVISAPFIFRVLFAGKYDVGLSVLPWAVVFCFFKGMASMSYNYLFCVERTKLTFVSVLVGLVVNIVLNALLLPWLGLFGAALATTCGCAINLAIALALSVKSGFQWDRKLIVVLVVPLMFCCGTFATSITQIIFLGICACTRVVFTAEEREQIDEVVGSTLARWRPKRLEPIAQ